MAFGSSSGSEGVGEGIEGGGAGFWEDSGGLTGNGKITKVELV